VSADRAVGVGVIGLGFMGRTHIAAYDAAREAGVQNKLVAVCDSSPERRSGLAGSAGNLESGDAIERIFDPEKVQACTQAAELLANPEVELVSICTPTDSHVGLALEALAAGKHVLVEKPVAVTSAEIERLVEAAAASRRLCMPAHCMRFWPAWTWLQETIRSAKYGAVQSAVFRRLASPPSWSRDFYADQERTGGALVDLHIHDVDFIRWCFGDPDQVVSAGSAAHLSTIYRYKSGPAHVVAEGGWDHSSGFDFQMRYVVIFDGATAEFDLARDPQVLLSVDGKAQGVELSEGDGYVGEVTHLLQQIRSQKPDLRVNISDAHRVAMLLERERESLRTGQSA
jgi:predicted dehydrogenase